MPICPNCKQNRSIEDFFGKIHCYKCVYAEKTKGIKPVIRCKFCFADIPRSRNKFCSEDCQKAHNDKQNKAIWWKKITIMKISFRSGS